MDNRSSKKLTLVITSLSVLAILALLFLLNRTAVIDWFKGIGYNPTPAMSEVKSSLALTGEGELVFNATHPLLASRDDFNESCESHDEAVSVLGCYTGDRIYVYNVEDESLKGIRESTAAHELLHAVWSRLTGLEKSELVPVLEEVYKNHSVDLQETIESYPESERIGEIYVRSATQIKDLPEVLETHYAKYFQDQDALVAFYDSYIAPFNELTAKIETLKSELTSLEKEISDRSAALDSRLATFKSSVDEFNSCANTAGCFNSWTFASRRANLVSEQQAINAENDAINRLIDEYNAKADTYNANILRSSELQNLINSNSPVETLNESE